MSFWGVNFFIFLFLIFLMVMMIFFFFLGDFKQKGLVVSLKLDTPEKRRKKELSTIMTLEKKKDSLVDKLFIQVL